MGNLIRVAHRLKEIEYAIRDVYAIAKEVEKTKKVHYLNIGDPGLFQDSFSTPKYICEALSKATFDGNNFYADSLGVPELRKSICEYENNKNLIKITPNDVLITSGVSEGIMFVMGALVEPGDEVLIPGPGYPTYSQYIKFFDGKDSSYKLDENNEWRPDIDTIRKQITEKTQAILVSSPNNPTGSMMSEKNIKEIINIAGEYNLLVISDEIYDLITFEPTVHNPATFAKDVPLIGLNGFSKAHMSTGWRLGYMYFLDTQGKLKQLRENMEKLARMRLCANTPAQFAAIESYKFPRDHTDRLVENLRRRRDYMYKRIQKIPQLSVVLPKGAFYMFPKVDLGKQWKTDKEFTLDLLRETGVCTVYGSGFGKYAEAHFRMTFLPSISELEIVFDKMEAFFKAHQ